MGSMIVALLIAGVVFVFVMPGFYKLLPIVTVGAILWALISVQKGFDEADRRRRR